MYRIVDLFKYRRDLKKYKSLDDVLYWFKKHKGKGWIKGQNFGDYLSLIIVGEILASKNALNNTFNFNIGQKMLAVGSVMHFANDNDIVWGSGINGKLPDDRLRFNKLDIRMVRGPKTKAKLKKIGIETPNVFGDPALLLPTLFPEFINKRNPEKGKIVAIPNLNEIDICAKNLPKHIKLVSPLNYWRTVLEEILTSELVLSSSLHGIILAEAFNVPVRFINPIGGETLFKYEDYYEGTGRKLTKIPTSFKDEITSSSGVSLPPPIFSSESILDTFPYDLFSVEKDYKSPSYIRYLPSANQTNNGIIVTPNFSMNNPYLGLLYMAVNEVTDCDVLAINSSELAKELLQNNFIKYKTLHIHWLHQFFDIENGDIFRQFIDKINFAKDLGYKIIWTVHNVSSHGLGASPQEMLYRAEFAELADTLIVHGHAAKEIIVNQYNVTSDKIVVAPHGSYEGFYENRISQKEARKSIGLKETDRVFLFFGRIMGYKGLDDLIEVFNDLSRKYNNIKLVIAGKSDTKEIAESLKEAAKNHQIIVFDERIAEPDIQNFFNASDIVVLPFKKILTSGSAILALTFKKPIIASRQGVLPELINDRVGKLFSDPDELKTILVKSINNLEYNEEDFVILLEKLKWKNIVEKNYFDLYVNEKD